MLMRCLFSLLAALFGALTIAGCGGDGMSKQEYESRVREISNEATDKVTKSFGEQEGDVPSGESIQAAAQAYEQGADDIDDLDPPEEVKDAHETLVEALRLMGQTMGSLGEEVEQAPTNKGKHQAITKGLASGDFTRAREQLARALDEFNDKGYRVFGTTSEPSARREDEAPPPDGGEPAAPEEAPAPNEAPTG